VTGRGTVFRGAREGRPFWVNLLNASLGPTASWIRLSPEALARRGRRAAEEAGVEGLAFVDDWATLLEAIESEADLHWLGRVAARQETLRLMQTQTRTRRALDDRPSQEARPMAPLIILGWPRTGSTHLLGLLSRDPANRALPYFESFDPVAPRGRDDRIERVDSMLRFVEALAPGYSAIHPMQGSDPEECVAIFMLAFRTLQFDIQYRVPSYVRWLRESDPLPAHRFHRDVLQWIESQRPEGERWLLKDPTHMLSFDALVSLHPGARFIHLHRDPSEAIASICSLYAHTRAMFSDAVDPLALGPEILDGYWGDGLDGLLEARRRHPEVPVADLRYEDLRRDPVAAIESAYATLELALSQEAREEIRVHAAGHPQHAQGRHRYSLERFGLCESRIQERFGAYAQRFGLDEASSPTS